MKGSIEYIKEAWGIYFKKENFIFFARIMAIVVIISSAIGYLFSYLYPTTNWQDFKFENTPMMLGFLTLTLVSIVIGFWTQAVRYFALFRMGSSEREIFRLGYKNILRLFLISLTLGLIVFLGAILLIIPAIIFGIWYSFSTYLVLDKEMGIKEALRTSKLMVRGRFFKVLGRYFVFSLFFIFVSIILSLIPYIGSLIVSFMAPLFVLPYYLLYRDLSV